MHRASVGEDGLDSGQCNVMCAQYTDGPALHKTISAKTVLSREQVAKLMNDNTKST